MKLWFKTLLKKRRVFQIGSKFYAQVIPGIWPKWHSINRWGQILENQGSRDLEHLAFEDACKAIHEYEARIERDRLAKKKTIHEVESKDWLILKGKGD